MRAEVAPEPWGRYRPYSSSSRSQISLIVGYEGTACHNVVNGTLPTMATVAIVGKVPLTTLWHAVPSYPTMSEIWLRLLEEYGV